MADGWPEAWGRRRGVGSVLLLLFFVLLGGAFLTAASVALLGDDRNPTAAFGLALLAVLIGCIVVTGAVPFVRAPGSTAGAEPGYCARTGEHGLAFRYSATIAWAGVVTMVIVLLLGTLVAVVGMVGGSMVAGSAVLTALLGLVFAVAGAWYLVDMARGAIRRGTLWLTPGGVVHEGWAGGAMVPWDAVVAVEATRVRRAPFLVVGVADPQATAVWRTTPSWKPPELAAAPSVAAPAGALASDPVLALQALHFYLTQPQARAELGSAAPLARLVRH